jgi:hypothetical protein
MTSYLYANQVRIFDYPRFADPFRNQLRENAGQLAAANGIEIEILRKRNVRKGGPGIWSSSPPSPTRARAWTRHSGAICRTNSGQVSRLLKRLRVHGLFKKVGRTYKDYLTQFGTDVAATGLKLRELVAIPRLAFGHAA